MSYDIFLERKGDCSTCHRPWGCVLSLDPTYNMTPLFEHVLQRDDVPWSKSESEGIRLLSGLDGEETREPLALALERITNPDNYDALHRLEPSNKWGDLKGAQWILAKMLLAAIRYPKHTWTIT